MSYVLEALKKAEAERSRGEVPRLDAHPQPAAMAGAPSPRRIAPWLGLAGGLGVGVLLVLAWQGWRAATAPAPAPVAASAPGPAATAEPAVVPPAPPPATPPATPLPPPPAAPAPLSRATPAPPRPPVAAPPGPPLAAPPGPPAAALPVPPPPPVAPTPPPAASPITPLAELPPALRREWPALTIGGAMYSDTPRDRMLIVNGQLLREGDRIAADLVLEQIRLRSAVLRWRERRVEVGY